MEIDKSKVLDVEIESVDFQENREDKSRNNSNFDKCNSTLGKQNSFGKVKIPKKSTLFAKRAFDIISSGIALLVLAPFFIVFTPIVAIKMKGNPFFVQERPGRNGKIFKIIKYRTMTNTKDKNGNLLPDDARMTSFGDFMRNLSIDELPELFNIFKGDMSVVGPRPQLVRDLWFMSDEIQQRHIVKSGLTGLAQIGGRNAITWEDKFALDLKYINNLSFMNDIKIIFGTIKKVLKSEDITQDGMATADDYGVHLVKTGQISQIEWQEIMNKNGKI